jgi:hypothetical protein
MFLQPHTDWQFSFTSFICLCVQQKIDNLFLPVMPAFGKKAFQVYTKYYNGLCKQKGAWHEINVKFVHNSNKTCQGKLVNDLLVCMRHYVDMFPEGSNVTMLIDFPIYLMLTGHAEPDSTGKIYKHN